MQKTNLILERESIYLLSVIELGSNYNDQAADKYKFAALMHGVH